MPLETRQVVGHARHSGVGVPAVRSAQRQTIRTRVDDAVERGSDQRANGQRTERRRKRVVVRAATVGQRKAVGQQRRRERAALLVRHARHTAAQEEGRSVGQP